MNIEEKLVQLQPQYPAFDRDAMMYEMGRRSIGPPWVHRLAILTLIFALTANLGLESGDAPRNLTPEIDSSSRNPATDINGSPENSPRHINSSPELLARNSYIRLRQEWSDGVPRLISTDNGPTIDLPTLRVGDRLRTASSL